LVKRSYTRNKLRLEQKNIWFNYNIDSIVNLNKQNDNVLPLIFDYSSLNVKLTKELKTIMKEADFLKTVNIVPAYRNSKNLKQLLVRSQLVTDRINKTGAFVSCTSGQCLTCRYHASDATSFTSTKNNTVYNIPDNLSCASKDIIYLITCDKCKIQYVGETGRALRERVTNHRYAIKNKLQTPIGIHFNLDGHSFLNMRLTPIECVNHTGENKINFRRGREIYWQNKLNTFHPYGLNGLPVG
jgi:hypothetical protein